MLTFVLFPLLLLAFIAWVIVVETALNGWFMSRSHDDGIEEKKSVSLGFQRFFAIAMLFGLVGYLLLGGGSQVAENLKVLFEAVPRNIP